MIKLRLNDEALLVAALTGFTCSCFGLVDVGLWTKKNLIIRYRASQNSDTSIPSTYPSILSWQRCTDLSAIWSFILFMRIPILTLDTITSIIGTTLEKMKGVTLLHPDAQSSRGKAGNTRKVFFSSVKINVSFMVNHLAGNL